jgi:hypothetical protein
MEEPGLPSAIKEKKPRTEAQIAAFEKMKAARIEKRLLGEPKQEEENPDKKKSLEMAAAMFMEMRKKDKENKQKQSWEE